MTSKHEKVLSYILMIDRYLIDKKENKYTDRYINILIDKGDLCVALQVPLVIELDV